MNSFRTFVSHRANLSLSRYLDSSRTLSCGRQVLSFLMLIVLAVAAFLLAACSDAAPTATTAAPNTQVGGAGASVDMPVYSSIEQLSAASDLVVLGTVKGIVAREVDYGSEGPGEGQEQGQPIVFYEIEVNETLRGKAGATVVMAAPDVNEISTGGEASAWRSGEQVLLFLVDEDAPGITASNDYYVTVSLDNGVFDRLDGDLVTPRMVGALEEAEYRLSEVRGKMKSDGSLRPLLLAQPAPDWTLVNAPGWTSQPGFSLRVPTGWRVRETQGIDSYVGEVVGDGVRLVFDYGGFSWSLDPADDPEHDYAVIYEDIGGVQGKLLIPVDGSDGFTGVFFARLDDPSLNLIGHDLTREQQRTAIAIFRSVRSGNVPGGSSIEELDPNRPTPRVVTSTAQVVELTAIDTHYDNNSISLWWEDPDWDVDYWVVERSTTQDGPWETIAAKRPGELRPQEEPPHAYDRWADGKLPPGDRYYYRIYSCTESGRSGYSNVVSGVVPEFMPGLPPPIEAKEAVDPPC